MGAAVACIEERDGATTGVRLVDGEVLPCELVIVGVGIVAAVDPLLAAGTEGDNSDLVDALYRASLPDAFAIGDGAAHSNAFESVQNANDQAMTVVRSLTGVPERYAAVPWFWFNQYDLKRQTVGLSAGHDQAPLRGSPDSRAFSVVYLRNEWVIALDCVNMARDHVQGKALVAAGASIAPAELIDAGVALEDIWRHFDLPR